MEASFGRKSKTTLFLMAVLLLSSVVLAAPAQAGQCVYGQTVDVHKHALTAHVVVMQLQTQRIFTCTITRSQYDFLMQYPQMFYWSCRCVPGNK